MKKLKEMFFGKDEKRRTENLIAFLIILIVTLIIINKILSGSEEETEITNETDVQLVTEVQNDSTNIDSNLQEDLEEILSEIEGVGEVKVLITYSESTSISPLYNESTSSSISTSSDGTTTETQTESKEIFTDSSDDAVIEKYIMPTLEGAIIIAEGGGNIDVKANIVAAVEAATGLLTHKIQVFEMNSK